MNRLTQGFTDVLELFFPSLCITCGERLISQEKYLCFHCWNDLPVTNYHKNPENKVAQLFWGRIKIEHASAFYAFKKGSNYQQLIHYMKYKGLKELGFETGRRFGFALMEAEGFVKTDLLIPVPLHPKKYKQRGYNQSFWIAKGISDVLEKPVATDLLYRKIHSSTQTRKNRFERWQNVDGIFGFKNQEEFEGKHVLLVDDVVTTGSTLEACAFQLLKIKGTRVSIATLAFADL